MGFIATHWYIWLGFMVVGYSYTLANQLRRMKGIMTAPINKVENTFFKGIGTMFVAAAIGAGGMVMLIIAIIVNTIKFGAG